MLLYSSSHSDTDLHHLTNKQKSYNYKSSSFNKTGTDFNMKNIIDLTPYLQNVVLPSSKANLKARSNKLKQFMGAWKGDDLKEMLELVYATRSKF